MRCLPLFCLALMAVVLQPDAAAKERSEAITASTVLKTATSWDGTPIHYPPGRAEVTGMVIELVPGAQTGWHRHEVPSFALVLEGELEVRLKNGVTKRFKSGEALAEVVDTLHNGRNVGPGTVKLVVFYAGAADRKPTIASHGP